MSHEERVNGEPHPETDEDTEWMRDPGNMSWMAEHVPGLRRSVAGHRYLYWSLGIAFVLGLALQIIGYLVRSSAPTEPLGLIADLGYALGWALWTGVVVVVFVQVVPEAKARQVLNAIEAYEAVVRDKARAAGGTALTDDGRSTSTSPRPPSSV